MWNRKISNKGEIQKVKKVPSKHFNSLFRIKSFSKTDDETFLLNAIKTNSSYDGVLALVFSRILFLDEKVSEDYRAKLCKQTFLSIAVTIYIRQNFFLRDMLNFEIENIKASGLIDHWHSQEVHKKTMSKKDTESPNVLTLYHFKGCFEILFVGNFISSAVFAVEMINNVLKKRFNFFQN